MKIYFGLGWLSSVFEIVFVMKIKNNSFLLQLLYSWWTKGSHGQKRKRGEKKYAKKTKALKYSRWPQCTDCTDLYFYKKNCTNCTKCTDNVSNFTDFQDFYSENVIFFILTHQKLIFAWKFSKKKVSSKWSHKLLIFQLCINFQKLLIFRLDNYKLNLSCSTLTAWIIILIGKQIY